METEEMISLPADSPRSGGENNELNQNGGESSNLNFQPEKLEDVKEIGEISGSPGEDADRNNLVLVVDNGNNMIDDPPSLEISFQHSETVGVTEKSASFLSVHDDNGCLTVKDENFLSNRIEDEFPLSDREMCASSLSGVKRPRVTVDEEQPLVRVTYKSLARDSKRKLEELLQQWSQWHAQHCSSYTDSAKALETGEDTYFPAIQVGLDKSSALSFWMESKTRSNVNRELLPLDEKSVPLYDRGFSLALTSTDGSNNPGVPEVVEGSRCFNCGSYNHSLKDCPKPRDNVAVTNARKQHLAKRSQNASSRNPIRYYQNSPGGKYDGLKPGALDSETRLLLGLGELDPPPWLNRMREIGYPPGYLDASCEDQPSGITIFGDGENVDDSEEGEILERSFAKPDKRMSVEFPGVNAPIPEKADEKLWAAGPSAADLSFRNRSFSRYNQNSDSGGRSRYHDQRPPRGFEDDEPPPPGCDGERSPMFSNSRRHGIFDSAYHSQISRDSRSSSFGRSISDRGRRNYDDSPLHYSYGYLSNSSPR